MMRLWYENDFPPFSYQTAWAAPRHKGKRFLGFRLKWRSYESNSRVAVVASGLFWGSWGRPWLLGAQKVSAKVRLGKLDESLLPKRCMMRGMALSK